MKKKNSRIFAVAVAVVAFSAVWACENNRHGSHDDLVLWYQTPGVEWLDGMPLGNGRIGAMVFGRPYQERIALNESSFWSGRPHDYNDPEAGGYFDTISEMVFNGRYQEAEKLIDTKFYGKPVAQQAYQPLGNLLLTFPDVDTMEMSNYRRDLDMGTGVASVTYTSKGVTYKRETFVSYPDNVMVVRITADKPKSISMLADVDSRFADQKSVLPGQLILDGTWKGPLPEYWLIGRVEGEGLKFRTALMALNEGGEMTVADDKLNINQANSVTLILTAATSYVNYHDVSASPADRCSSVLGAVGDKSYKQLKKRHTDDFSNLMGRVSLNVGNVSKNTIPTDERLEAMRNGEEDTNMEALCFQFGRYALVSSSRAGGQPANLQGIWNEDLTPNWGSKYTININTEMNYWPTEVCNLSECHQPMFDMLKDIAETGHKTAKVYYDCTGWVAHHNIDLWRGTAPVDAARFGMWPVGGAWLCQDIWEHYAFTQDMEFLKEYYPIMKGSAEFLLDLMVVHPTLGYLVTPFSMSPEHGFYDEKGELAYVSPMPTMDMAIIRELFPHCIEAGKLLGIDEEFGKSLEDALTKIPPLKVNQFGTVQEWVEDWKGGAQGHNFSANFPFFPGQSILFHRDSDKELVKATNNWMDSRNGGGGFPLSWDICMWARLQRGDKVASCVNTFVSRSVAKNLHNRGSYQSDGTFGFTAGVAEALLQSHEGEISLLPALPTSWAVSGTVKGLKARGGYEVDMSWRNGKLEKATIKSQVGGKCQVRYGDNVVVVDIPAGKSVNLDSTLSI